MRNHGSSAVERTDWGVGTASPPGAAARGFIGLCSHISVSNNLTHYGVFY